MKSKIPEKFWNRKSQQEPYFHPITGFRLPTRAEEQQTAARKPNRKRRW